MAMPEPFEPIKGSFLKNLKDRWDHPVAGPFLFSWVLWHYDFLMVLFSEGAYNVKYVFLYEHFPMWTLVGSSAIALGFALVYVVVAQMSDPLQDLASFGAVLLHNLVVWIKPGRSYSQAEVEALSKEHSHALTLLAREQAATIEQANLDRDVAQTEAKRLTTRLVAVKDHGIHMSMWNGHRLGHAMEQMREDRPFKIIPKRGDLQGPIGDTLTARGLTSIQVKALLRFRRGPQAMSGLADELAGDDRVGELHIGELQHWGFLKPVWTDAPGPAIHLELSELGWSLIEEIKANPEWKELVEYN